MNYSYEDVPTTNWKREVWRAAKLGEQAQLDLHYVGSEEIVKETTERVYYFTPPAGTVTLAIAKNSNPTPINP